MGKPNGKKNYCCYIAEMVNEIGVTRSNLLQTKKIVLSAVKALVEAEIEHLESLERRNGSGGGGRGGGAAGQRGRGRPFSVPLSGFEKRRRA